MELVQVQRIWEVNVRRRQIQTIPTSFSQGSLQAHKILTNESEKNFSALFMNQSVYQQM